MFYPFEFEMFDLDLCLKNRAKHQKPKAKWGKGRELYAEELIRKVLIGGGIRKCRRNEVEKLLLQGHPNWYCFVSSKDFDEELFIERCVTKHELRGKPLFPHKERAVWMLHTVAYDIGYDGHYIDFDEYRERK